MARRSVDQDEIDRAAARAEGKQVASVDEREPGEAELTSEAVTPESEPQVEQPVAEEPKVEELAPEPPSTKKLHSKREEVIARAKAKRAEEQGDPPAESEPTVEQPAAREEPPAPDQPIKVTRKLKVDRVERELSEDEYDNAARVGVALQNRLAELNQLLPQLRGLANHKPQGQTPSDDDSRASPPETRPQTSRTPSRAAALPDEELDRIGASLVYGDDDERRQALRDLANSVGPAVTVEDVLAEVDQRNARTNELERAGQAFAQKHGIVATDPGLQTLTTMEMQRRAIDEMRAIGVEERYLRESAQNLELALFYHGDLRRQGHPNLSDAEVLADSAAEAIKQRYRIVDQEPAPQPGVPRPTPTIPLQRTTQPDMRDQRATRTAEKEQMRQPRRAAMIARTPGAPPPKSTTDVVNEKRRARGYTTV